MTLVLILIAAVWIWHRNQSTTTASAAATQGGWHVPPQTAKLGGVNIRGNTWANGTDTGQIDPQWSGYDAPIGNIVFAVQGGEDGMNPSLPVLQIPSTQVTVLPRFRMLGSGDPTQVPVVPIQISTLNDVVRR